MTSNPYEPVVYTASHTGTAIPKRRHWVIVGFALGCAPIAMLGMYGLYVDAQYAATLPPHTPRCGNGVMAAMILIFPVSPFFGCLGAGIGFILASVWKGVVSDAAVGNPDR